MAKIDGGGLGMTLGGAVRVEEGPSVGGVQLPFRGRARTPATSQRCSWPRNRDKMDG